MKTCPRCGKRFNWWQRVVGEYKDHVRVCDKPRKHVHDNYMSMNCRGCPAECFKETEYSK